MENISWSDFEKIELRAGTVLEVIEFPIREPYFITRIKSLPGSLSPNSPKRGWGSTFSTN